MPDRTDICAYCRFFKPFESGLGACRRHSPRLIDLSAVDPGHPELGRQFEYQSAWPLMSRDEWCGDFEPKRPN